MLLLKICFVKLLPFNYSYVNIINNDVFKEFEILLMSKPFPLMKCYSVFGSF